MRHGLMGFVTWLFGDRENYMRAFPPVSGRRRVFGDLFEGV